MMWIPGEVWNRGKGRIISTSIVKGSTHISNGIPYPHLDDEVANMGDRIVGHKPGCGGLRLG